MAPGVLQVIDSRRLNDEVAPALGGSRNVGFFVGDWHVKPSILRIQLGERVVKLEPRVMQVLEYLAQHPNEVVARADLETAVWRGRVVGYEAIGRTVTLLRKALGDDSKQPKFIETLSKKGYRLIAPVSYPRNIPQADRSAATKEPDPTNSNVPSKNKLVAAALLVFIVIGIGGAFWLALFEYEDLGPPEKATPVSIVVLPFKNLSSDPRQSYVADGITDSLITDLTKISGLFVIARHTAFKYRREPWRVGDLARELNVRFILQGSVQREAETLRINAALTDATTGSEMWAERYDGSVQDIFGLQDRIARNVVSSLSVDLTPAERDELAHEDTANLEAYEYFLRGRERYFLFSRRDNDAARNFYLKAIELDPFFARAYAMLALTYRQEVVNGWSEDREKALDAAMQLAEKALSLDEAIPEAYFVKGLVHRERRQYFDAILAAEKAIEIDPNYADGHVVAGSVLYLAGRAEEGLELVEKAMRLNPHYPHNYQLCQGQALYVMGSYDEAVDAFKQGLDRYPQSERLHLWLAATYAQIGESEHAEREIDQVYALNPSFSPEFLEHDSAFRYQTDLENFLNGVRKAMRMRGSIAESLGQTSADTDQ